MDEQQEKYLDEVLLRATSFEELVRTKGWEHIQARYQSKLSMFVTDLLNSDEPISTFEAQRNELKGMKTLLGFVDSDLQALAKFREEQDAKSKSE